MTAPQFAPSFENLSRVARRYQTIEVSFQAVSPEGRWVEHQLMLSPEILDNEAVVKHLLLEAAEILSGQMFMLQEKPVAKDGAQK